MTKFVLLTVAAAFALAACQPPAPPPPPPPPPPVDFIGIITEKAGPCFTIVAENGTAYAVNPGGPIDVAPLRARIRVVGVVHPAQDCPGRTKVRADSVTVLAGPPPGRRPPPRRPRGPDPK
jgi:hypothetical protein